MWLIVVLLIPTYYFLRYLWELVQLPGLSRRAVFISGADRGFGHLLALKCAANGMPVFAGCLTDEGREGLTAKAKRLPGTLHALPLDVRDEDSVKAAAKYVEEHLTGGQYLWAVVNNAGVLPMCPDAWSDMSDINQAMNVNCYGTIRVTHAFLPMLKKSKGRVISASSICGRYALPGVAGYTISKYGVEAYMDSIRRELKPFGIRCSILEPGGFRTGIMTAENTRQRIEASFNRLPKVVQEEYGEKYKERRERTTDSSTDMSKIIAVESYSAHFPYSTEHNFLFVIQELWQGYDSTGSDRLDYVVDAYYHAITARWPRIRYRCGWETMFIHIPITFLPTELEDIALHYLRGSNNVPACLEKN